MSGHRAPLGPRYRAKALTPGWWCCNRLMVPGEIPASGDVRLCRHCGTMITVTGQQLLVVLHQGHPPRRRQHPDRKEQSTRAGYAGSLVAE